MSCHIFQTLYMAIVNETRGIHRSHLSKGTSHPKRKCSPLLNPFSSTAFHALLHRVICYALTVSFGKHFPYGKLYQGRIFVLWLKFSNSRSQNFHFKVFRVNIPNIIDHLHHMKEHLNRAIK